MHYVLVLKTSDDKPDLYPRLLLGRILISSGLFDVVAEQDATIA